MRKFIFLLVTLSLIACGGDNSSEENIDVDIIIPDPDPIVVLTIQTENNANYLNFGNVVKSVSKSFPIKILNEGDSVLKIEEIVLPEGFSINFTLIEIAPDEIKELEITFSPTEEKEYTGFIQIASNATSSNAPISIKGIGVSETYEGDVDILNQEELEDFVSRGYKRVNGKLNIGSAHGTNGYSFPYAINDLMPLKDVTFVKGLNIIHTTLTSIEGVENLEIEGFVQIAFNGELKNLKGFPETKETGVALNLNGNHKLEDIKDLIHVKSFLWLSVVDNVKLVNLEGLNNVTEVEQDLRIQGNLRIENLNELTNLKLIGEDLSISNNQALYSFCGLLPLVTDGEIKGTFYLMNRNRFNPGSIQFECERLVPLNEYHGVQTRISGSYWLDFFKEKGFTKISGEVFIKGNQIKDLLALSAVEEFSGVVYIEETQLTSLEGLNNLKKIKAVIVKNNPSLSDYCALTNVVQNQTTDYGLTIRDNLYNPTKEDLKNGDCKQ
ncbi:Ig-like domain-containing protein [Tenacibaculum sp. ZS6-P6]|uniref:Ig-like domain-containing protein n=1 Tax=Tenacibaculum sp. ZS6-P6 TaxID=3447503 RepID=UPI003F95BD2B